MKQLTLKPGKASLAALSLLSAALFLAALSLPAHAQAVFVPSVPSDIGLKSTFSASTYGVKGDGSTDDTAALQAAINAAAGGVLVLPAGNYLISAPLKITNTMLLQGPGKAFCTLTYTQPTGDDLLIAPAGYTSMNSGNSLIVGVRVQGIAFRCKVNKTAGALVHAINLVNSGFSDCSFNTDGGGKPFDGLYLDGGPNNDYIHHCDFIGAFQSGASGIESGTTYSAASYAGGVGIRMGALSLSGTNIPGSDVFINGGNQVLGWSTGITLEGDMGGVSIADTDIQQNMVGLSTSVAAGSSQNRELYLGQGAWLDTNAQYGMLVSGNVGSGSGQTLQVLEVSSAWAAGNGRYNGAATPGVSTGATGGGGGFGIGIDGADTATSIHITNGKIYQNQGSGLQLGAGIINVTGCHINNNGGVGGNGVFLGNIDNIVLSGNSIVANGANSVGYGVYFVGSLSACAVTGNIFKSNLQGPMGNQPAASAAKVVADNAQL